MITKKTFLIMFLLAIISIDCTNANSPLSLKFQSKNYMQTNLISLERAWSKREDPAKFFNSAFTTNINYLPTTGRAPQPWSGSYYPLRYGGIATRYAKNTKNTQGYFSGREYIRYTLPQSIAKYQQPKDHNSYYGTSGFQQYVSDNYSPAEKYDLLVGDFSYTLTNKIRNYAYNWTWDNGDMASWVGICHGWAPASFWEYRPRRSVTLTAADGVTKITFLPDDIKALISQFWAIADYKNNFLGLICDKYPSDVSYLFNDEKCASLNPGSFTVTVANQIGLRKKSLIFDPDANPEIWNHPAYAYSMTYYNPLSDNTGGVSSSKITLAQAKASSDSLVRYTGNNASSGSAYIIGVNIKIDYVSENNVKHSEATEDDVIKSAQYKYLVELDSSDNILGGEWLTNKHPDYIWKPDERYTIKGAAEDTITSFRGSASSISGLSSIAKKVSAKRQVIKSIAEYLVEQSR